MSRIACEAILLRAVDFGESDRIAHLLTPEVGRLTVIAKGARRSVRRFPGTLDVFNHLRVAYRPAPRGGMAFLEQAILISPFLSLRVRPARYALASYLSELLDRMAPERGARVDTERIFDFALAAWRTLETIEPDRRMRLLFELRALDALGLRPSAAPSSGPEPGGGPITSRSCRSVAGVSVSHRDVNVGISSSKSDALSSSLMLKVRNKWAQTALASGLSGQLKSRNSQTAR
jgi:hypothetical protein